jgi:S1-C subfamily serine protease
MSIIKKIPVMLLGFFGGIAGGIFADQILWPYLIERPLFYEFRLEQAPINITKKEEIIVKENTALQNATEKVQKSIVGIRSVVGNKTQEGIGVVITSDGLILALNNSIPQGGDFKVYGNGKTLNFKILKRDSKSNLALLKVEDSGFQSVGFAEYGSLRYGERVFISGILFSGDDLTYSVNEGAIKTYNEAIIKTNMVESGKLTGSPMFDIDANMVGISLVDSNDNVSAISIKTIKDFAGF